MPRYTERVEAVGHEHVRGTHTSTLEITTDEYLTPAGDCIVGIGADRAPDSFAQGFTELCATPEATISCTLAVGDSSAVVTGRGDPRLTLASDRSLVLRTSQYVDDRTLMIEADRAASDLPRSMINQLADGASLTATITVRTD